MRLPPRVTVVGVVLCPLCLSSSATGQPGTHPSGPAQRSVPSQPTAWVRTTLDGQRPRPGTGSMERPFKPLPYADTDSGELLSNPGSRVPPSVPTRHPAMFSAPVPQVVTLPATVPASGLRATHQSSAAGLSAVPQPCQRRAPSVAGAVICAAVKRDSGVVDEIPRPNAPVPLSCPCRW